MPPGCFAPKAKQQLPQAIPISENLPVSGGRHNSRPYSGLCVYFGFFVNPTVGEGLDPPCDFATKRNHNCRRQFSGAFTGNAYKPARLREGRDPPLQ